MKKLAALIALAATLSAPAWAVTLSAPAWAVTLSAPAWAVTQTVTLSVPGMTCAACPITVKKALSKVDSVLKAEVSYKKREAVVTFDDTQTSADALTKATANVGYPASVRN